MCLCKWTWDTVLLRQTRDRPYMARELRPVIYSSSNSTYLLPRHPSTVLSIYLFICFSARRGPTREGEMYSPNWHVKSLTSSYLSPAPQANSFQAGDIWIHRFSLYPVFHSACLLESVADSGLVVDPLSSVLIAQSCLILWDPVNCSPPGSSVCGILWARRNSPKLSDLPWQTCVSHSQVCGLVVVLLGSPRVAYTWLHTCIEFRFISCGNSSFWDQLLPGIFSSHDYGKTCKWPSPQNKAYGTNSGIWNALHSYLFIPHPHCFLLCFLIQIK